MPTDLLADDEKFPHIADVRDAVRLLLKWARECDRREQQAQSMCEADMRRYLILLCTWVITSQQRRVTEKDRVWLEQVLGFDIERLDFETIVKELRIRRQSVTPNPVLPLLLRTQIGESDRERRIIDPCDSTIRQIEAVVRNTASVLGIHYKKEASMARRVSLQLRSLIDAESERLGGDLRKEFDNTGAAAVELADSPETIEDVKAELMALVGPGGRQEGRPVSLESPSRATASTTGRIWRGRHVPAYGLHGKSGNGQDHRSPPARPRVPGSWPSAEGASCRG